MYNHDVYTYIHRSTTVIQCNSWPTSTWATRESRDRIQSDRYFVVGRETCLRKHIIIIYRVRTRYTCDIVYVKKKKQKNRSIPESRTSFFVFGLDARRELPKTFSTKKKKKQKTAKYGKKNTHKFTTTKKGAKLKAIGERKKKEKTRG